MLILTRRPGQRIRIGDDVVVIVQAVVGRTVRLGFEAPPDVKVWREEIWRDKQEDNRCK